MCMHTVFKCTKYIKALGNIKFYTGIIFECEAVVDTDWPILLAQCLQAASGQQV